MSVLVTNIQRFSLHDGPGIRTTIFFKGCSLHCPWCANPETINPNCEYYYDKEKCIRKGNDCVLNGKCAVLKNKFDNESLKKSCELCLTNAISKYGNEFSDEQLFEEIIKDKIYYETDGGVTLSGGEPLLQIEKIEKFLKKVKDDNINIAIETSLNIPRKNLEFAFKYVDYYIIDCKILDSEVAQNVLGLNVKRYKENLDLLINNIESNKILVRIPVINNYTNGENIKLICELLNKYNRLNIQIFSGHELARKKYDTLNKRILTNVKVNKKELEKIKEIIPKQHKVEIIEM